MGNPLLPQSSPILLKTLGGNPKFSQSHCCAPELHKTPRPLAPVFLSREERGAWTGNRLLSRGAPPGRSGGFGHALSGPARLAAA